MDEKEKQILALEKRLQRIEKSLLLEPPKTDLISVTQACYLLGISRATAQRHKEKIGFISVGGKLFISQERFEEIKIRGY